MKDSHDFTNSGAPRKLRSGRTMRTTVARDEKEKVRAMNNDDWSIKISSGASKHLMVERKIGFHKRSKSSSFKWKPKKKKTSGRFVAFYDDYRGPAREHKKIKIFGDFDTTKHIDDLTTANSLPKRELFFSEDMKKLARLLRSDYPIHSKPRGKLPVHNRAPDKI
ncbi:Root meristem growth factor 4 [Raphanus sativus]|nr:Root meristem growth factor 4 [Raphanus sativus]